MQRITVFSVVLLSAILAGCQWQPKKVDFSTQIKPLINKNCITCHGGVKRNSNFSLLFHQDALDTAESGSPAIIPGDPDHSEMIRRLSLEDPEERMPFKKERLTKAEISLLRQWIKEGANWGDHWAYVPPVAIEIPEGEKVSGFSSDNTSAKNGIDYFIHKKLKEENLEPSSSASPAMLARRVYLDLIGMPPTMGQLDSYLNDKSPDAYDHLVDTLLASPRFGEKWASWWLDMARYSDTKGYERDVYRNIWRYRDWVIKAFNEDKPFDRFTIEQLAGDLLVNPSDDQMIATAFHRNTMNNDEGGTEDEEFRVAAVIDRVNTTMEVWQSTTMACVQCHSHPYDPFRHEDYYKLMAFFNDTRDEDTHGEHPKLRIYREDDEKKLESIREWVKNLSGEGKAEEVNRLLKTIEPKYHPHDFDSFINGELIDTKFLGIRNGGSARLKNIDLTGKAYLLINHSTKARNGSFEIRTDQLSGEVIASGRLDTTKGWSRTVMSIALKPTSGKHDLYFVFHNIKAKGENPVSDIEWFAFREDFFKGDANLDNEFITLLNKEVDNTPIMIENPPRQHRTTAVFERGNWLVKSAKVSPSVPKSLNPFPDGAPLNRLGLAQWLVASSNPLTSRTVVNRVWEQFFGAGLVETLEDFGTQGSVPSHPELLDWLSLRLMNDHHWSLKKLMKDIVISSTYRQDSKIDKEKLEKDPANKWLSRGARVRLSAEQVRDQALAVSGLLSNKMYGPGVMPYQPDGVWQSVYSAAKWQKSIGEDQFRRAVYTFQKRTSPYPSMITFDGSSREVCQVRRIRTNTPLQSLVTLNDPVYQEASIALAKRMLKSGKLLDDQIRTGYQLALLEDVSSRKLDALRNLYNEAINSYAENKKLKESLNKEGSIEEAAMTIVAAAILNLDETLTKS